MKNIALGYNRGFTLIELLVVIAILGVIAAVVAVNVGSFLNPGEISEAASYTIYVEEGGIQKIIGTIIVGNVSIQYPKIMNIGDSKIVSLTLIPQSNVTSESNVTGESTNEGTYYTVSGTVQFYSVMYAELKVANFMINSDSIQYKEVSLTSRTVWVWVIAPNTPGEQSLIVELSTPVRVQGYEGLVSRAVYDQPIQILVRKPFDWRILLDYWYIIVAIIGTTIGVVFGLRKIWKISKRKKTQKAEK
jgi:prepilin-type N-terminal cleavage/methylation domain-containing protein